MGMGMDVTWRWNAGSRTSVVRACVATSVDSITHSNITPGTVVILGNSLSSHDVTSVDHVCRVSQHLLTVAVAESVHPSQGHVGVVSCSWVARARDPHISASVEERKEVIRTLGMSQIIIQCLRYRCWYQVHVQVHGVIVFKRKLGAG